MAGISNLVSLLILLGVVAGLGWVGYQVYLWTQELADRGVRSMEKRNLSFTKDGVKIGVRDVRPEEYADRTQHAFVSAWQHSSFDKNGAWQGSSSGSTAIPKSDAKSRSNH